MLLARHVEVKRLNMRRLYFIPFIVLVIWLGALLINTFMESNRVDFESCLAAVAQKTNISDLEPASQTWKSLDPGVVEFGTEIPEHCERKHYVHWGTGSAHRQLFDRWNMPLRCEIQRIQIGDQIGVRRRVVSSGPDKIFGTADDISSDHFNKK